MNFVVLLKDGTEIFLDERFVLDNKSLLTLNEYGGIGRFIDTAEIAHVRTTDAVRENWVSARRYREAMET